MRKFLITAAFVASPLAVFAADNAPTMDQCKAGYKSSYSSMWTEAQFKKACDTMMGTDGMKNSNGTSGGNATNGMKPGGKM